MNNIQVIDESNFYEILNHASEILKNGDLVAFPTETVYGLGANALDGQAVAKIFSAKGRTPDNPLIVHIADMDTIYSIAHDIPDIAIRLARAFWPGPLTMVVPKNDIIPDIVTAGLDTVAIRMPENKIARHLIELCGFPIAAPSANLSGRPSPTLAQHVYEDLGDKIPLIIDGGQCSVGLESTVISFQDNVPKILRPGDITAEDIKSIAGQVILHNSLLEPHKEQKADSPGMLHKHYAPKAGITIVSGEPDKRAAKIKSLYNEFSELGKKTIIVSKNASDYLGFQNYCFKNTQDAAHSLFKLLRDLDTKAYNEIIFEDFETDGLGLAVMNRLLRAADFNIIQV